MAKPTTGTPRWVKVFGAIALVVVLLVVVVMVTGVGGEHGPGRHSGGGDGPDRQAAPSGGDTARGHTPPPGVDHRPRQR